LKILIIGLGGIGQRHTRNLRALLGDSVEIIAYRVRRLTHVVTPTMGADQERNVEDVYNIRTFHSLDDALAEKPDIAYVCNPSSLHVAVTRACLLAGCDIFLEKPLADSLDGTAELLDLARTHRRIVMVGYQLRFHPCIVRLTEIVRSGVLGNLLGVRAVVGEYLPKWHPYEDYRIMYAARADLGGGVVLSQIHEFDYLYSLFGLPSRIYAVGGHWSDLEVDVEDTASILMEAPLGPRSLPIHLHQDYLQFPPSRSCEVIGDRGRVIMDLPSLTVTLHLLDKPEPDVFRVENFDRNNLFLDQARHFLRCVETREKPIVDLADGIQSLRMALAVKQSIADHKPVDLVDQAGLAPN
jgi:predicted dehydrogenase